MASKRRISLRSWVQLCSCALSNGYAKGFMTGTIYQGPSKRFCLPGLNCYSCPGALGACPIGSLQAVLSSRDYGFSFYVVGFLILVGSLAGRFVCGWLCPFGWIQDLLYKIPVPKKLRRLPGERFLRWLKYVVLMALVIVLPLTVVDVLGQGTPWFCAYLCPAGTLFAGIPLIATNPGLQEALGALFSWKLGILIALLILSAVLWRPFCRYLCPLGAIYGCFNHVAVLRHEVDASSCTHCGACQHACPLDIPAMRTPNSPDCVRCGACRKVCPTGALHTSLDELRKRL